MSSIKPSETPEADWLFWKWAEPETSIEAIASAWCWEIGREALKRNPKCLDWLWADRDTVQSVADALTEGAQPVFYPPWYWMPQFPEQSISSRPLWDEVAALAKRSRVVPYAETTKNSVRQDKFEGGADYRLYTKGVPEFLKPELGVEVTCSWVRFPIRIDLSKTDTHLANCFEKMVGELRDQVQKNVKPIVITNQKGQGAWIRKRKDELRQLAAFRCLNVGEVSLQKVRWEAASNRAKQSGVYLFGRSKTPWRKAQNEIPLLVTKWSEKLNSFNRPEWKRKTLWMPAVCADFSEPDED